MHIKMIDGKQAKRIGVFTNDSVPSYFAHSFSVMKMAQGFFSLGNYVEVVTNNSLRALLNRIKIQDIASHYGISKEISVKYIRSSLKSYVSGFTAEDSDSCKKVLDYIRKNRFDFIYCRDYFVPYAAVKAGVPTIVESHSVNYDHPGLKKIYEIAGMDSFKGLVTIHKKIKEAHVKRGILENKILVLEDGVDLDLFDIEDDRNYWRSKLGLDTEKRYVIYSGHLYKDKGIEFILKLAKRLESYDELRFLLVGGFKKDKRSWEKYCKKAKIGNVSFVGFVDNIKLPGYLKAADCLILPYDTSMPYKVMDIDTTSPLKLFEYMAAKRPIVATAISSITKILKDKHNSMLVEPDSIDGFSSKILDAVFNKENSILGERAFIDVGRNTWKERAGRTITLFE